MAAPVSFRERSDSFPLHRGRRPYIVRVAAARRGISFGLGGGQIAVQLTPEDRDMLTAAAAERGVSVLALTTALMHGVLGGRLVDAVLDDRGGASRREPLP
jgi:hypothetical protein